MAVPCLKLGKPIGFTIITHRGNAKLYVDWVQGHALEPLAGSRDRTFTGGLGAQPRGALDV